MTINEFGMSQWLANLIFGSGTLRRRRLLAFARRIASLYVRSIITE